MMKQGHSIVRLLFDSFMVVLLVLILSSPIFLIFTLKISDLNLQAKTLEIIAGATSKR